MLLLASPTSPYAWKVRVAAIEKDLENRIKVEMINPMEDGGRLSAINPLGKVPTLVLESGAAIYDSLVICDYLDQLDQAPSLLPAAGPQRFETLTRHALAQGVADAAVSLVMESRRPQSQQSDTWQARWSQAIRRGLAEMDRTADQWPDGFDLGHIATACALGYLEFRLPELAWRGDAAGPLTTWWEQARKRSSIVKTAPPS